MRSSPSSATFLVWLPIFATSLGYAAHQARPEAAAEALLRTLGWPLATAFVCTGIWAPLLRKRRNWAALLGVAGGAETARRRPAVVEATSGLSRNQRLAVVPATGMLAAWGAAAGVNLASMLPAYGLVRPGRQAVIAGNALLLGLGAVGARRWTPGAPLTSRTYAGTLAWALAGVVAGQRRRSASAALCAAVSVAGVIGPTMRDAANLWPVVGGGDPR